MVRILALLMVLCFSVQSEAETNAALRNFLNNRLYGEPYSGDTKCATRYQLQFVLGEQDIDPDLLTLYKMALPADTVKQRSLITPSGHFRLSWDESGVDRVPPTDISGNGYPDYIDSAAVIFDHVWQVEIDQLGYTPPPGPDGSPVKIYNVYFSNMDYYGITYFDKKVPNIPETKYTSYIEIDNDFVGFTSSGLLGVKVTAAHEFHHAIQFGYNIRSADFFFYEMTSTWLEDRLYPEVNDYYQYLPYFFNNVSDNSFTEYELSPENASLYPYGNSIYLIMLDLKYGPEIVYNTWQEIKSRNALAALTISLAKSGYNTTWQESLNEYGVWLYYTGSRVRSGEFFPKAAEYPEITIRSADKIDFGGQLNIPVNISGQANRFIEITGLNIGGLDVIVSTSGSPQGGLRFADLFSESEFIPLNRVVADYEFTANKNIFIITNTSNDGKDFSVSISSPVADEIAISSNPVIVTEGYQEVQFKVPENAEIYIFTVSGRLVAKLEKEKKQIRTWNMTNQQGKQIASGIYFWLVKSEGLEELNKFSVIR